MGPVDLNRCIQSTLIIARSEYKYMAELKTEFGEVPLITYHGSQISQVVLSLVVNAAHADAVKGTDDRGLITVKTYVDSGEADCREHCKRRDGGLSTRGTYQPLSGAVTLAIARAQRANRDSDPPAGARRLKVAAISRGGSCAPDAVTAWQSRVHLHRGVLCSTHR